MLLMSAGHTQRKGPTPPPEASSVVSNTRFARALELLGNYPFCGGTLQQTRRWIARRNGTNGAAGR